MQNKLTLSERDKEVIWHPYTPISDKLHIPIIKGKGVYLYDENEKQYIDAISSWWVNTHGHSHPHIAEKVFEQLNTLEHVIFAGFTHPKAVELAERLLAIFPSNQSKIFYSDNGSTAVEVAIKMALQYWHNQEIPKTKIIALEGGYHGDTFGAMSVSGRSAFTQAFSSFLFDVIHIESPVKGNEKTTLSQFNKEVAEGNVAAFIYEPLVQGVAGMKMYSPQVLEELLQICNEYKVITIADEVMTAFGRTAKFFASDYVEEKPDIICLSKGLTGGTMALGVTSCSQKIQDAFISKEPLKTFYHGHSFTANPVACAAACASLDLFANPTTWENIYRIQKRQVDFVQQIEKHPMIKESRQFGTILAIEFNTKENSSYFNPIKNLLIDFFLERGIIIRPLGNIIYIMPPYCISDDDLSIIFEAITELLELRI